MPADRGDTERCSAIVVLLIRINIVPCEQQFHHPLMPFIRGTLEWGFTVFVWHVGIDIVPCEQ